MTNSTTKLTERLVEKVVATEKKLPEKRSLFHAHLDFAGNCKGYERHMRRGSAVCSVFGYLVAMLTRYPNQANHVYPGKRRIQERTFKWIRINRKNWSKSAEHYSRCQIYRALQVLEEIGAITPSKNGWIIHRHGEWTKKEGGVCCLRHLRDAPTLPKKQRTRGSVLEKAVERRRESEGARSQTMRSNDGQPLLKERFMPGLDAEVPDTNDTCVDDSNVTSGMTQMSHRRYTNETSSLLQSSRKSLKSKSSPASLRSAHSSSSVRQRKSQPQEKTLLTGKCQTKSGEKQSRSSKDPITAWKLAAWEVIGCGAIGKKRFQHFWEYCYYLYVKKISIEGFAARSLSEAMAKCITICKGNAVSIPEAFLAVKRRVEQSED
jgi:hypothetical protein